MKNILMILLSIFGMNVYGFLIPFTPYHEPNYPICKNCISAEGTKCKIFGNLDLISGTRYLLACKVARQNETMCGIVGKFYMRSVPFTE